MGSTADLFAGIIRRGGQRHQGIQIPHQTRFDGFPMAAQLIALALQALFLKPGIQRIKTFKPRNGDKVITPHIADQPFHLTFFIALGRAGKLVLEQVM